MKRIIPLCATALLLSGCFDLHQSFIINDDNSASYEMNLRLSSAMISMLAMADSGDEQDEGLTTRICNENELISKDIPEDMDVAIKSFFKEDNLVCNYRITGPLARFSELNMRGDTEQGGGDLVAIAPLDDNRVEISSVFDFSEWDPAQDDGDEPMNDMAKQMMGAMMTGRTMRWSVTAPRIIESSGEISDDGRTATWELPLSVAFAEPDVYEFRAVASYAVPWYQKALNWLRFW